MFICGTFAPDDAVACAVADEAVACAGIIGVLDGAATDEETGVALGLAT